MKLDTATWRALSALLDDALDLDAASRSAWLDGLRGDAAVLRPLLHDMLMRSGPETAAFVGALPTFDVPEAAAAGTVAPGAVVGAYRVLRELGRGGMGEVWLAERTDGLIRRPVALKLPLLAWSRPALADRFARERDILASLAHPYIARLYDAGFAADGQPYLALEYVEGTPIIDYADSHRLSIDQRLTLFAQVTDAVASAHASLVLHRDLKPSNILVTAQGEVKLLDFGVARLLDDGRTDETELTRLAGCALTPDYAAPEQIAGVSLTTAVDVYALGVLLCELLAGTRPYRLKRRTRAELEEAIATADPVLPSRARLEVSTAAARSTTPARLRRTLAGDLDAIVAKALRKVPAERYAGVQALGEDLARFRRGVPVLAQPDRFVYRARKFVARHRGGLAVTAVVTGSMVGVTGVALYEAGVARHEAQRADAGREFVTQLFQRAARNNPGGASAADTTVRQLLDLGSRQLLERHRSDPELRLDLIQMLARLNLELDLVGPAAKLTGEAVSLAREIHGPTSIEFARALAQRGSERYRVADYRDAIADMQEVVRIAGSQAAGTRQLRAKAHMIIGNAMFQLDASRPAGPRRELETALALLEEDHATTEDRSQAAYFLAWTYDFEHDFARAEPFYRDGISAGRANFGERSFIVAFGYDGLADNLRLQGRLDEALDAIGKALDIYAFVLGPRHGTVAFARTNLALIEAARGERAEAERDADAALALAKDVFGAGARQLGYPAIYAARLKANRGELENAVRTYDVAMDVFGRNEAPTSLTNRVLPIELAEVLIVLGDTARASALLDQAETNLATASDLTSVHGAWLRAVRGELALARGDVDGAAARFDLVLREIDSRSDGDTLLPRLAAAIARTRPSEGRAQAIFAELRARGMLPSAPDAFSPRVGIEDRARLEFAIGHLYHSLGREVEARTWLASAVKLREHIDVESSPWLAEARVGLAEVTIASAPDGVVRDVTGTPK